MKLVLLCCSWQRSSQPGPVQEHQEVEGTCPWSHPTSACTEPRDGAKTTKLNSLLAENMPVWISVTYLANKVRHVLDVGDLPRLTIIQARAANLISLHAVFNLRVI